MWIEKLKDLRSTGMTMQQIGDCLGITKGHVSRMVRGLLEPKASLYIDLDALHRSRYRAIKRARGKV